MSNVEFVPYTKLKDLNGSSKVLRHYVEVFSFQKFLQVQPVWETKNT